MKTRFQQDRQRQFQRLALVTALACAMSDMALAQASGTGKEASAAKNAPAEAVLETVIVTAEKREVPLQKTAIAITALGAKDLEC